MYKKIESNNKMLTAHWTVRQRQKREWLEEVMLAMPVGARGQHNNQKKKVEIISRRSRLLDKDNLYGGCKGLIDSLKFYGLIVDDSPEWCDLEVSQEKSKDEKTIVKITQAK